MGFKSGNFNSTTYSINYYIEKKKEVLEKRIILHKDILLMFSKFPEPYKSQAINNLDINFLNLDRTYNTNKNALLNSFDWDKSKEGYKYWKKFYDSFITNKKNNLLWFDYIYDTNI